MATNINSKSLNKSMKTKIFSIMILFCMLMFSGYSVQVFEGDSNSLPTLPNDLWTKRIYTTSFSTLEDTGTKYILDRQVQDIAQETLLTIQVYNSLGNRTMNFTLATPSFTNGFNLSTTKFSLQPDEQKVLGVLTNINNEEFEVTLRCTSGCDNSSVNGYQVVSQLLTKQEGSVDSYLGVFLSGLGEIVTINVLFWQIMFYVFLFVFSLAFVVTIFGIAFLVFKYGKRVKENKEKWY